MLICGRCNAVINPGTVVPNGTGQFQCPNCGRWRQLPDMVDDDNLYSAGDPQFPSDDDDVLMLEKALFGDEDSILDDLDSSDDDDATNLILYGNGNQDTPNRKRKLEFNDLLDSDNSDEGSGDGNSDPRFRKKRKITDGDGGIVQIIPVGTGPKVNIFKMEKRLFRFAFWNLENMTGDIIYQGSRQFQSDITSAKNIVRISFCAEVVKALDLDCLAVMELGSDGETVLNMMVNALQEIDPESQWHFTMSTLTGSVKSPRRELKLELNAYKGCINNIHLVSTILPYYRVTRVDKRKRYKDRHIRAHQLLARRSDRVKSDELEALFEQLKEAEGITHNDIADQILNLLATDPLLTEDEFEDHRRISLLFREDDQLRWETLILELETGGHYQLLAMILVLEGTDAYLEKNDTVIFTDGPFHALRCLGFNVGRYERYGILFRTGLYESYLTNQLVMTDLMREGEPTNRRAAISFRMPLGLGFSVGAFMIHSMYTPALEEHEKMSSTEGRQLRVKTLVAQAEYASKLQDWERPVYIFGDTNVDRKDIDTANQQMASLGYERIGGELSTTLRIERTLRSAFTRNGDFYSQPFDAVYQLTSEKGHYPTEVSYPGVDNSIIQDLFLRLLSHDAEVRNWYFIMLKYRYTAIYNFCKGTRTKKVSVAAKFIQGAVSECSVKCRLSGDAPSCIKPTTQNGQKFLSMLFVAFREVMNAQGWAEDGGALITDDDGEDEQINDEEKPASFKEKASLQEHVRAYCRMAPETERAYLLFHRHFISDHRIVMMGIQYETPILLQRIQRQPDPVHWPGLEDAIRTAGNGQGFGRQGTASGRGSSCFLYTLLQLVNNNPDETGLHEVVRLLRRELALGRAIPRRGFLDPVDEGLGSWVRHNYRNYRIRIWARDTNTGALVVRHTIGNGGTTLNMLLDGNHYTPLWP